MSLDPMCPQQVDSTVHHLYYKEKSVDASPKEPQVADPWLDYRHYAQA